MTPEEHRAEAIALLKEGSEIIPHSRDGSAITALLEALTHAVLALGGRAVEPGPCPSLFASSPYVYRCDLKAGHGGLHTSDGGPREGHATWPDEGADR